MASGMETLLNTVLKSMGFNPQEFIAGAAQFTANVQAQLADFDARLSAMEKMISEIHAATVKAQPAALLPAPVEDEKNAA